MRHLWHWMEVSAVQCPFYDIDRQTGATIRGSIRTARWRRSGEAARVGFSGLGGVAVRQGGPATGQFATSYSTYRHTVKTQAAAIAALPH